MQTVQNFDERALAEAVGCLFISQAYPLVFSRAPKPGIEGTDELGVPVPEGGQWRQVDVFGCRWNSDGLAETVAVECKRASTVRDSVNAALGQATDYQLYFHRVYVATETGPLVDRANVLVALALGHIEVETERQPRFNSQIDPTYNPRFDDHRHSRYVKPRASLGLAFQEVFSDASRAPLRYGDVRTGGIWLAKAVTGNLQWNCWFDPTDESVACGINVEHKDDIRRILRDVNPSALSRALHQLTVGCQIRVEKHQLPRRRGAPYRVILPRQDARKVDIDDLRAALSSPLADPNWGPHLNLYTRPWNTAETLQRCEYADRLRQVRQTLGPVMNAVAESYGSSGP
jgi:hypothetical protein